MPDRPSVLCVLKSCTLLNELSDEQLDLLAPHCHLASAERGEVIWIRGEQVNFFGIVGVGYVKMVHSTRQGNEITQEVMGPGQVFGLLGAVEGMGCPLSARAVNTMWYLKVPKAVALPIIDGSSAIKGRLVRRTSARLRQAHEMLARLSTGKVESRVAAILVMLGESYGVRTDTGLEISIPLTRQDIAEMAGTTVESTIRLMSRWQKQGILQTRAKLVTLLDDDRLVEAMSI